MPRNLSDAWNPFGSYPDEAPSFDHWCPTCRAERDRMMSLDHDADVIAARDPIRDPSHRYASDRDAAAAGPDVLHVGCLDCYDTGTIEGWACHCRMAGVKA